MDSVHKEREGILGLDELNETIAYSVAPEPPPEWWVAVCEDVAIVSVAARGHSLQTSGGNCLVVVPQPPSHVVPEHVRHVVTRGRRQAVVRDHTLQVVAQLLLQPEIKYLLLSITNPDKSPNNKSPSKKLMKFPVMVKIKDF